MHPIQQGTSVKDIRGRQVGVVATVRSCCIELKEGGRALQPEAVLAVGDFGVELICDADQLGRFACPIHSRVANSA